MHKQLAFINLKRDFLFALYCIILIILVTGCSSISKEDYSHYIIPTEKNNNTIPIDSDDTKLLSSSDLPIIEIAAEEEYNNSQDGKNVNTSEIIESTQDNTCKSNNDIISNDEQIDQSTEINNIIPDESELIQKDNSSNLTENPEIQFSQLAPTVNMTFEELVGDNGLYDLPTTFPKPDTYKIIVDKYYQVVMVYKKDESGEYTIPVRYMLCTTGASATPTPTGTYQMKRYRVRFGLFKDTNVYGQYWSLITGRIYFHSILYSEKNAVKYTTSYKKLGTNVSHGCVRLTVPDARWIWYNAAPGTEVVIRNGSSSDKTTAEIRNQLVLAQYPSERPENLTGDAIPFTDNWLIEEVPQEVDFINGTQSDS